MPPQSRSHASTAPLRLPRTSPAGAPWRHWQPQRCCHDKGDDFPDLLLVEPFSSLHRWQPKNQMVSNKKHLVSNASQCLQKERRRRTKCFLQRHYFGSSFWKQETYGFMQTPL
ncbi:hypothetical protein BS78_01G500600 [Paspalum vaginatum]|nr:hypothetical protein BS78_01G500600 [Paspalum vaginatum]